MSGSYSHFLRCDWRELMRVGLGVLSLSPSEFWAMTPRELDAAVNGVVGRPSLDCVPERRDLLSLMKRFPD